MVVGKAKRLIVMMSSGYCDAAKHCQRSPAADGLELRVVAHEERAREAQRVDRDALEALAGPRHQQHPGVRDEEIIGRAPDQLLAQSRVRGVPASRAALELRERVVEPEFLDP